MLPFLAALCCVRLNFMLPCWTSPSIAPCAEAVCPLLKLLHQSRQAKGEHASRPPAGHGYTTVLCQ